LGLSPHDRGTLSPLIYLHTLIIYESFVRMEKRVEKIFSESFWDPERVAGLLLFSAILIPILMLVVFALHGNLSDVFSQIGGAARNPFVRNVSLSGWITASLLSLAGFNLISILLQRVGEKLLSGVALTAMLLATALLVLEATIHLAFGAWASDEFLRTGSEPALYSVFFEWSSVILQRIYVSVGYIGLVLFGWSILQTAWLPGWAGWMSIAWGGGMLGFLLLSRTTLPATLLIPGGVIGMILLTKS
jgi:hypothetical protein